ncbi:MAG: hypothetical protein LBG80_20405 [Bacteroidales bacterium]|nr:hypothetical protein [Bacteroidales bacterium]
MKKIRLSEFEYKEVLNCSLIDFLFAKQENYNAQHQVVLKQLCNKIKNSIAFIDCYIEKGLHLDLFANSLCKEWNKFWDFIVLESGYSDEKKDIYLKLVIEYVDIETITQLDRNKNISNYLSKKTDFLEIFADESKIRKVIKMLNIKFQDLIIPKVENKLFNFIYENGLYEINRKMIEIIIGTLSSENFDAINTANYTTIKASGLKHLIKYVEDNFDIYIEDVFLTIPENTQESEDFITELLCREEEIISLENRKKIITKQITPITNLSSIEEMEHSLIEFIVEKSKMAASWENVICYYELKDEVIDNILISFFNQEKNHKELSKAKLSTNSKKSDEVIKKISSALILCLEISDHVFGFLMKSIPYSYNRLAFENLSNGKVNWMITNHFLNLTIDNFNLLNEHFNGKHIDLLKQYPHEFIEKQAEYSLNGNDVLALLNSSTFNQQQKISIIKNTDGDIIIDNKNLSNLICDILAEREKIELDFDLLKSLIQYGQKLGNKLKLFIFHFDSLDNNQITRANARNL